MAGSRRVSLTDLGSKAAVSTAGPPARTETPRDDKQAAAPAAKSQTPAQRRSTPKTQPRRQAPPDTGERVRFDELERKETRLRADQLEALNASTKRLNRARNRSGDRITDNTLIRVAVDLLLAREADLAGTTESELRNSVGL